MNVLYIESELIPALKKYIDECDKDEFTEFCKLAGFVNIDDNKNDIVWDISGE